MSDPEHPGLEGNATRRIIAAIDFSDGSSAAAQRAHALARLHGARLTLLHVAPDGVGDSLLEVADRGLAEIAAELGAPAIETEVLSGSVSTAIIDAAERLDADLIVVGAHGANWLKDMFIGSTAETVANGSEIPVLLVKRPDAEPYDVVMLALDLAKGAEATAKSAMALTPGSQHVLVHIAFVVGENLLRLSGAGPEDIEQLRCSQTEEAAVRVQALAEALHPARTVVEPGRPEQQVPQLAHDLEADLIAVGAKRRAGLRHALLGSVARHTVRHAPSDVLIVRTS